MIFLSPKLTKQYITKTLSYFFTLFMFFFVDLLILKVMSNFLITIITINLNNLDGLKRTFYSIINQSSYDIEFIVIDGNSIDGSVDFLRSNCNLINHLVIEKDEGIYYAMNKGALLSSGEYLFFLNSGDELCKNVLKKIIENIKYINSDIFYGKMYLKTNKDSIDNLVLMNPDLLSLKYTMSIFHPSTLIKRNIFFDIGTYNTNFKLAADYYFFLKAYTKNYRFTLLDFPISIFEGGGFSSKNAFLSLTEGIKLKYDILPFYISIPSILQTICKFYLSSIIVKITRMFLNKTLYFKVSSKFKTF